ncbi:MAG: hypothetical protein ACOVMK_08370, partial [Arenimonas sp.]
VFAHRAGISVSLQPMATGFVAFGPQKFPIIDQYAQNGDDKLTSISIKRMHESVQWSFPAALAA